MDEAVKPKSCLLERPTSRGHTFIGVPGRIQAATCADERISTSQSSGLWGRFLSYFHSEVKSMTEKNSIFARLERHGLAIGVTLDNGY